jgi:hypothetical protein
LESNSVGVLVDESWVSSIARSTGIAVDDGLSIKTNWG